MKTKAPIIFRIKRSPRTQQFRCLVQAGNNEIILTGEPCKNRKDVQDMIENVLEAVASGRCTIADETVPTKKPRLDNSKLNRNWP